MTLTISEPVIIKNSLKPLTTYSCNKNAGVLLFWDDLQKILLQCVWDLNLEKKQQIIQQH